MPGFIVPKTFVSERPKYAKVSGLSWLPRFCKAIVLSKGSLQWKKTRDDHSLTGEKLPTSQRHNFGITLLIFLSLAADPAAQSYRVDKEATGDGVKLIVLLDEAAGVEVTVAPEKGGELSGLKIRYRGRWVEVLYRARDYHIQQGWSGRAPFLWPATGRNFTPDLEEKAAAAVSSGDRLNAGAYVHHGRRYEMPIHGFVRDLPWKLESGGADSSRAWVILSLVDTVQTRDYYPYGFLLTVEYSLSAGSLEIKYKVRATLENRTDMPFSLGNHITFKVPFLEESKADDMLFSTPCEEELLKTEYGVPNGARRPCSLASPTRLAEFNATNAISLSGYSGTPNAVLADPAGLGIRLTHSADRLPLPPFVLFNVWGDPGSGYFSPEPWMGIQNSFNSKEGLIFLAPDDEYQWVIAIEALRNAGK